VVIIPKYLKYAWAFVMPRQPYRTLKLTLEFSFVVKMYLEQSYLSLCLGKNTD